MKESGLWIQADIAEELDWSPTYIQLLIKDGTLTPQFHTRRGVPLFTPEYWEWAKENVKSL